MERNNTMTKATKLGGTFTLSGTSTTIHRMGYGAMQLSGPEIWGPPRDVDAAIAVLREAVDAGVNHIDTSDYYGPHVTNQIIKKALHPYRDGLLIVTKLGARRGEDKSWNPARSRQDLIDGVHDNLRNLGLDALDVVNLRVGGMMEPIEGSIEEPITVLDRTETPRIDSSHRRKQRKSHAIPRSPKNHRDRVRPKFLQRSQSQRRRLHRRSSPARYRLRPLLPARRIHPAAILGPRSSSRQHAGHPDANRPSLAPASFPQHPTNPRHLVAKASARESQRRNVTTSIGGNLQTRRGSRNRSRRHRQQLIFQ